MPQLLEIKLTPREAFFFGEEVVFGGGLGADDRRRSYLVHSGILPQQTTLLGMLRETILRQNDALLSRGSTKEERLRAAKLVGNQSFNGKRKYDLSNFGVIDALSPLILEDQNGGRWQPHPLDDNCGKEGKVLRWKKLESAVGGRNQSQWLLENYSDKYALKTQFSNGIQRRNLGSFFSEQVQVGNLLGNRKAYENRFSNKAKNDKDEGLFRQTQKRNSASTYYASRAEGQAEKVKANEAFSFVFRVVIDADEVAGFSSLTNTTVIMGGERSTFDLEVRELERTDSLSSVFSSVAYQKNTGLESGFQRLVLLSDTFLPANLIDYKKVFVAAQTKPFRFFSSRLSSTEKDKHTENFYHLAYDKKARKYRPEGRTQSTKYTLLRRGGVLIGTADDLASLGKTIETYQAFRQIGYNHYTKV